MSLEKDFWSHLGIEIGTFRTKCRAVSDPGEVPLPPPLLLLLHQTEARRAKTIFFDTTTPPPPSHAGVSRGARISSLPTNACSTEDNIPFPHLANHAVLSKFWKVDLDRRVT